MRSVLGVSMPSLSCSVMRGVLSGLILSAIAASSFAGMPQRGALRAPTDAEETTDQLIIKLRDPSVNNIQARVRAVGAASATQLTHKRQMSGNSHVVQLAQRLNKSDLRALARRLAADPNVASVEPDFKMYAQQLPNDPMYAQQWHYFEPAGGINLPPAWDITTGSANVVVAVIDTGIRPHADLAGKILPGYDFISDITTANDGDGRDADASDPGDYGCNGTGSSSWHGTHVAGTIGAASNNSSGVSGVSWGSKLLPVRVLGRCGGYTSDIVDGLRWASGIAVPGVPANPTPARVANLSLGGANGGCSTAFQNAVNDVTARGMVVVVAAGNSAADAAGFEPASCTGVVAVAATGRTGAKASYSNFGAKVAIAAPGGSGSDGVLSTMNAGATTPGADSYAYYQGTSMATPHVAGTVALMLSANPALTVTQVMQMLQSSARRFPTGTGADCTTATCGAGIVDAGAAVAAAARGATVPVVPVVPVPTPSTPVNVALPANGGVATASSSYSSAYPVASINNGDRRGANWGSGGGWNDATGGTYPDWVQIDFNGAKAVSEIDVFTVQDNYTSPQEPTETQTFSAYGITSFEVQYWNGSAWITVPGGSVTGNNKVWRKFSFAAVTTSRIRILVTDALNSYSRITEVEAYQGTAAAAPTPPTPPTPTPPVPTPTTNVASQANGGVASATSTYSTAFPAAAANNGDRRGLNWGAGGGWNDASGGTYPDALQINFSGTKSITEIDVFTVQDAYGTPSEPTPTMTFSQYGITDFDVQYWNGSTWITVPGGSVSGNNLVWRKFTFAAITTNAIRVNVRAALNSYSRIVEVEAY
jgi:serine protease